MAFYTVRRESPGLYAVGCFSYVIILTFLFLDWLRSDAPGDFGLYAVGWCFAHLVSVVLCTCGILGSTL